MEILKEVIVRYVTDGRIVKAYDQEEIIRCKDCRFWQDNNGGYPHPDCKWNVFETPDADDYCSGAERKEE